MRQLGGHGRRDQRGFTVGGFAPGTTTASTQLRLAVVAEAISAPFARTVTVYGLLDGVYVTSLVSPAASRCVSEMPSCLISKLTVPTVGFARVIFASAQVAETSAAGVGVIVGGFTVGGGVVHAAAAIVVDQVSTSRSPW